MAFSDALLARLDTDRWLVEAFSLKNRPHQGGTQGQAYGANAEYDSATPHASAQRSCWSTRTCPVTSSSTSSPQGPSRLGNLVSHQLRFTGERDANTLNLLYYTLRLDEPAKRRREQRLGRRSGRHARVGSRRALCNYRRDRRAIPWRRREGALGRPTTGSTRWL